MNARKKSIPSTFEKCDSFKVCYKKADDCFSYSQKALLYFGNELADAPLWDYLRSYGMLSKSDAYELSEICRSGLTDDVFFKEYYIKGKGKHRIGFVFLDECVYITFTNTEKETAPAGNTDELTGLLTRSAFVREIEAIASDPRRHPLALFYLDAIKFKAINDIFGFAEGDKLLVHIATKLRSFSNTILSACRDSADKFAFLAVGDTDAATVLAEKLIESINDYYLPLDVNFNIGIYVLEKGETNGNSAIDKAILAKAGIKGNYTKKINFYSDHLRAEMLSEQEITGFMGNALESKQFSIYLQPQYNHSTGLIVGAEALVRWIHPEKGMISPAAFIPIYEKNGLITKLDMYVFEEVCAFQRKCIDAGYAVVPISVNFSKHDIFSPNFIDNIEAIREKYSVQSKYLRVEVTESTLMTSVKAMNEVLSKLHDLGYIIEMDDFGSGYSSLNVLKDLEFDIIKLDMLFLSEDNTNGRGGTILSSVVNMAKWLGIPIIAEGVETVEQADFLRSIGCDYIQGYLYSRPLSVTDYEALISKSAIGAIIPHMNLIDTINSAKFWDPMSQETLIFSNFVGGAAIFEYRKAEGAVEMLRVNKKYLQELGMNLSEKDIISTDITDMMMDNPNKEIFIEMLDKATETDEEQECETWRLIKSECCGDELLCIRSNVRMIGKSDDTYLFYSSIRNVTAEKQMFTDMANSEKRFKMASEQVNIYFWEYTVATREMRPCFRCMRDLGLPPLLRNYPDSAIERGIFPPEVADMYRDWHVQVANGVKELEAVIPLTMNRVPFRVRYTTEFDENDNPIKAYGSAALVV